MKPFQYASVRRTQRLSASRGLTRGFTLIELLLVMVILAILAAVIVPKFSGRAEQAKETRAKQDVQNMKTALKMFEVDTGSFPTSLDELLENTGNITNWHGPYMDKQENQWKDPWLHDYIYHPPTGDNTEFQVLSAGPDGQEGTADDIK
jgi:general secretion pathway protein G